MDNNVKFSADADELFDLAAPLVRYLKEKHHPHCTVVVTDDRVRLLEDTLSVPYDKAR